MLMTALEYFASIFPEALLAGPISVFYLWRSIADSIESGFS